ERGAQQHLDLWSTCEALDLLGRAQGNASTNASLWAARRRAGEVILAMQELDGSFARFERGEGQVPLARLPWNDADRLAMHPPNEHFRVRLGARALTALSDLGLQASDDRLERGLANLEQSFGRDGASWEVGTLAVVTIAATRLLP